MPKCIYIQGLYTSEQNFWALDKAYSTLVDNVKPFSKVFVAVHTLTSKMSKYQLYLCLVNTWHWLSEMLAILDGMLQCLIMVLIYISLKWLEHFFIYSLGTVIDFIEINTHLLIISTLFSVILWPIPSWFFSQSVVVFKMQP